MCSRAGVPVNIPCKEMMGTADDPSGCKIAAAVAAAKAASVRPTLLACAPSRQPLCSELGCAGGGAVPGDDVAE